MAQRPAHWDTAGQTLGSTLVAFSGPGAFLESLEEGPGGGLWGTAVRRGAEAGRRARAKRKREAGGAEAAGEAPELVTSSAASAPAPVAVLLTAGTGNAADEPEGQQVLCDLIQQKTGLEVFQAEALTGTAKTESLPGPVGLVVVVAARGARVALAELGRPGPELQGGCVLVLAELPPEGLAVTRPDGPPYAVLGLQRDKKDKKDILSLMQWDTLEAAVKEEHAVAEVAGLAVPSMGAAVFYPDGHVEAFQEPLVRVLPRPPPGSKAARWELLDEDGNALKLPQGFAPHESPFTVAAGWVAEGGVLAFTGAGISKESGVPTYRDGNGLWKRYDAMEVSSIAGLVGEPAKVWDFEREFNDLLRGCKGPNAGHYALAELEASGRVDMVVTQNVDGFHQAAGSRRVVELHGSEVHAICLNQECGRRTEMSRIFGGPDEPHEPHEPDEPGEPGGRAGGLWSPLAPGWGTRWPEGPEDTALQTSVRRQLTALQERARKKKGGSGSGEGSSVDSGSDGSSGSGSSSSSRSLPRQCVPKPLTEEERAQGCPAGRVPICPHCRGGILKPDGIFFGEALEKPILKKSLEQSVRSSAVLMVGTSGQVDPAAKLPLLAKVKNKAKVIEVNLRETRLSRHADLRLLGASAAVLPKLQRLVAAHPRTAELQALREAKVRRAETPGRADPPGA